LELQEAMTSGAALARDERITSRSARLWKLMALSSLAALAAVLVYGSSWMWNRDTAPGERTAGMVATQLTDYGGSESGGALSPDGRSFVFVSDHGGTPDLWMRQVSSSAPIRLTADAVQESNPVFSPDGQTVYYSRGPEGGEEIWRVDAFGGQPRKVFDRARAPVPSPDGGRIAFLTVAPESALVVAALDGSSTRILVRSVPGGDSERPAWSPDGRWLSYARWNLFGPINLWLVEVATGHSRQITRFVGSSDGIGSHAWLPDSRHLVVTYETVY